MGTINYKTSAYITVGYDCRTEYARDDFWETEQEQRDSEITFLRERVERLLESYDPLVFPVQIAPGYYEGVSLDIDPEIPVYFGHYGEKAEAQKEITALKRLLLQCIEEGLVVTIPGWCTGYLSPDESRAAVLEAVKAMRKDISGTPTERTYRRTV